jgi:putative addiction module CopG family antidote
VHLVEAHACPGPDGEVLQREVPNRLLRHTADARRHLHTVWANLDNSSKLLNCGSSMSKVITPHFERLIDRFVASGRFNNKSEVIRAGLRLLEEHEAGAAAGPSRDDLSRIIQTSLADPRPLVPARKLLRRRQRR